MADRPPSPAPVTATDPSADRSPITAWVAWGALLLVVLGFGVLAVALTTQVAGVRSELERNVQLMIAVQNLPDDDAQAREALQAPLSELEGATSPEDTALRRSLMLVHDAVGREDAPMVRDAFETQVRRRNAALSATLGTAWDRSTWLTFASLAFALISLLLGAIAVRTEQDKQGLTAQLAAEATRAETADVLRLLNKELATARDDALEAQRMKTHLLDVLGHELRTPLNAIRGYAELLEEEGHDDAPSILRATHRLERRVAQILDLNERPEALTLPPADFEIAKILRPLCKRWGATLSGDGVIRTRPSRLERAVDEVLANAAHFGETVRVLIYSENGKTIIDVSDDGPGMQPSEIARATEPFWQADMTSTRRTEGLGLGLAVAKHHIEALDGTLEIESQVGTGTVVRMIL